MNLDLQVALHNIELTMFRNYTSLNIVCQNNSAVYSRILVTFNEIRVLDGFIVF